MVDSNLDVEEKLAGELGLPFGRAEFQINQGIAGVECLGELARTQVDIQTKQLNRLANIEKASAQREKILRDIRSLVLAAVLILFGILAKLTFV